MGVAVVRLPLRALDLQSLDDLRRRQTHDHALLAEVGEDLATDEEAVLAVFGLPDPKWGETPLALVIPRAGADIDTDALLAWANARLAKAQCLRAIELRQDFPRNALGKVIKRELRAPYWEEA